MMPAEALRVRPRIGLLGYTGFVGGNVDRQLRIDARFNRSNIADLGSSEFDLFICAGAPAEKWRANADPEADESAIRGLISHLERLQAQHVVLISTVDVYPEPNGVDEDAEIALHDQAYGRHRRMLERWVEDRFSTTIVRLPALYGEGLKKNAVYDLLNGNQVEKIHAEGSFQWYGLERLWSDIEVALDNELPVVNFAVEPVTMRDVAARAFGMQLAGGPCGVEPARYDFRSRHAGLYGGRDGYFQDRDTVLAGLTRFVAGRA